MTERCKNPCLAAYQFWSSPPPEPAKMGESSSAADPCADQFLSPRPPSASNPSWERKCAYTWGAHFSYQEQAEQNRFLEFLKNSPTWQKGILEMERSAKSRGNVELGQALHQIFEQRLSSAKSRDPFIQLPSRDDWGDTIYLERGSRSEQTWNLAKKLLPEGLPRHDFAAALAYYVSVQVPPQAQAADLEKITQQTRRFYQSGHPLPPHLKIYRGKDGPNGHYDPKSDTLSLREDWDESNWAHEWGHFLMDLMDDQEGPNDRSWAGALGRNGAPLFDPQRCVTVESVSLYAGVCDAERRKKGSWMPVGEKSQEDPAETFAYVMEEQRGKLFHGTAHMNLQVVHFKEKFPWMIRLLLEEAAENIDVATLRELSKSAAKFHQILGRDVAAPPLYPGNPRPKKKEYLEKLSSWCEGILNQVLPEAQAVREEKIAWAAAVLQTLKPSPDQPNQPNPKNPPWEIPEKISKKNP